MSFYNPFGIDFSVISNIDLKKLTEVSEGWYVEYKTQVTNASSIAKSISAFANTYGGWLFYGIKEKSKEEPVAGSFPGIAKHEVDGCIQKIRQAVAQQTMAPPHFELKIIWLSSDDSSDESERAIICIFVPWSPKAPHVHKSGVIFRRVADGSEPVVENDRHVLSELFKRSEKFVSEYKSWIQEDPEFTDSEKNHPYLRLLITADPWNEKDVWLGLSTRDVRKIFNPDDVHTTLPFDSVHTTSNGFVARQLASNDPASITLTWYLNRNLRSEVLIPIPVYSSEDLSEIFQKLNGYKHKSAFIMVLEKYQCKKISILDINQLISIFTGIAETQKRIHFAAGCDFSYKIKSKILNANRCIPYLDVEGVVKNYDTLGIPVFIKTSMSVDNRHSPDSFTEIINDSDVPPEAEASLHAITILVDIFRTLGVPIFEEEFEEGAFGEIFLQIKEASQRSMEAQRLRNQQKSLE